MDKIIILQPHHLLCFRYFKGKGYSLEFIENMKNIIFTLNNEPGIKIKLVNVCDEICKSCPLNNNGICSDFEKVNKININIIKMTHLNFDDIISYRDAKMILNRYLSENESDKIKKLCADCEWLEFCISCI